MIDSMRKKAKDKRSIDLGGKFSRCSCIANCSYPSGFRIAGSLEQA